MKSKRVRRLAFLAQSHLFGGAPAPEALPRLVFTVTNGRSGSGYLHALFERIDGVQAEHEPSPRFDALMRDVQFAPDLAARFWRAIKLPAISKVQQPVYAETSHLFCKGFVEPLIALGAPFDIVVLRRDKRAIARSLWRNGSVPGRSKRGQQFFLDPDLEVAVALPEWRELSDYQLCYWHVLETEARQRRYAEMVSQTGGRVVDTSVETLNDLQEVRRVLSALDIPLNAPSERRLAELVGERVNHRDHVAGPTAEDPALDQEEQAVLERITQHAAS